ncbi:hypothetical protein [Niveispirillum sp.]|uniref:hypothetical protein n=1 Tax=Niveispirillum sp. TaxID=1917217 RepID=UPI001B66EFC3|nr:hypothetical protein [Niveispirillum sp.]MBP7335389.1 hypothetical protein [Niveispirillum sp.]
MGNSRRYVIELLASITAYGLLLVGVNKAAQWGWVPDALSVPVALLPMAGGVATVWVIMRHIRRLDEMQRRMQFEGLAFGFAMTALITFSYGFLEGQGWPKLSMFVVLPLMNATWVLGYVLACRRYG